jgi:hypothetical protein
MHLLLLRDFAELAALEANAQVHLVSLFFLVLARLLHVPGAQHLVVAEGIVRNARGGRRTALCERMHRVRERGGDRPEAEIRDLLAVGVLDQLQRLPPQLATKKFRLVKVVVRPRPHADLATRILGRHVHFENGEHPFEEVLVQELLVLDDELDELEQWESKPALATYLCHALVEIRPSQKVQPFRETAQFPRVWSPW